MGIPNIAFPAPATQATQSSSARQLVDSIVSGTVAVIQQVKQPSGIYQAAVVGQPSGASQGAAQAQQNAAPEWAKYAIGLAAGLLIVAAGLAVAKHGRR